MLIRLYKPLEILDAGVSLSENFRHSLISKSYRKITHVNSNFDHKMLLKYRTKNFLNQFPSELIAAQKQNRLISALLSIANKEERKVKRGANQMGTHKIN